MSSGADSPRRRRIPIRWRLAVASAFVTSMVLLAFALALGSLLSDRERSEFSRETSAAADTLAESVVVTARPDGYVVDGVDINDYAASQQAKVRIVDLSGGLIASSIGAPELPLLPPGEAERDGYLVETRSATIVPSGTVLVQYARAMEALERSVARIWLLLAVGVVAGSLLSLLAALAVARRTLRPLNDLTAAAMEVVRTADPGVTIPVSPANDEVRDLAVTLSDALRELDESRERTEQALSRQREFVADASHELRTPLTALIANLEMLAADSSGEAREDAEAALRSGRRMRDLVTDLLALARSDADPGTHRHVDLAALVESVIAEVTALLGARTLERILDPVTVNGDPAALTKVVGNLLANAIHHTPDGSRIRIGLRLENETAVLAVEDSGPGIPLDQRAKVFERFYRQAGDTGSGTGLGLAIVAAVVEDHGGAASIGDSDLGGAALTIRLPAAQVSTTTAITSGRLPS